METKDQPTPATPKAQEAPAKPNLQPPCPQISANIMAETNWLFERIRLVNMPLADHERAQRVLGAILQHIVDLERYARS